LPVGYRSKNREKVKVACHYLFSAVGSQRQRNLLKTSKRSLKSFNCSCVIGRKYNNDYVNEPAGIKIASLEKEATINNPIAREGNRSLVSAIF
jgi:hypothetical protein